MNKELLTNLKSKKETSVEVGNKVKSLNRSTRNILSQYAG